MSRPETRDITLATGLLGSLGAVLFGERHLPARLQQPVTAPALVLAFCSMLCQCSSLL